ncbi:MAG: hypothetical protein HRT88_20735, partial [Lentisphaeraceae bacterium]|nr:hypothetical protein [Lentisphaeraceae bacterium]
KSKEILFNKGIYFIKGSTSLQNTYEKIITHLSEDNFIKYSTLFETDEYNELFSYPNIKNAFYKKAKILKNAYDSIEIDSLASRPHYWSDLVTERLHLIVSSIEKDADESKLAKLQSMILEDCLTKIKESDFEDLDLFEWVIDQNLSPKDLRIWLKRHKGIFVTIFKEDQDAALPVLSIVNMLIDNKSWCEITKETTRFMLSQIKASHSLDQYNRLPKLYEITTDANPYKNNSFLEDVSSLTENLLGADRTETEQFMGLKLLAFFKGSLTPIHYLEQLEHVQSSTSNEGILSLISELNISTYQKSKEQ